MTAKNNNETKTKNDGFSALRVSSATKDSAIKLLISANKKEHGRKITVDDLVSLALAKISKEDLASLQKKSLRNKDRQAIIYQYYCKKVNKVSEDEFIGITMTPDYFSFLNDHLGEINC